MDKASVAAFYRYHTIVRVIMASVFLSVCLLCGDTAFSAIPDEADLFEQAYGHYQAGRFEKAAELFGLHVKEYQNSSVGDSALYWQAKSFLRLQRPDDARRSLNTLLEKYPESTFSSFARQELDAMKPTVSEIPEADKRPDAPQLDVSLKRPQEPDACSDYLKKAEDRFRSLKDQLADTSARSLSLQTELDAASSDKKYLSNVVEELRHGQESFESLKADNEKLQSRLKKNEDVIIRLQREKEELWKQLTVLAEANKASDGLATKLQAAEQRRVEAEKRLVEAETRVSELVKKQHEVEQRNAEIEAQSRKLRDDNARTDALLKERESRQKGQNCPVQSVAEDRKSPYDAPALRISGKLYTRFQVIEENIISSRVLSALKVESVPWRRNSPYEDFLTEQIVYAMAGDGVFRNRRAEIENTARTLHFDAREQEYLIKYLTIDEYIRRKIREQLVAEERIRTYYEDNQHLYVTGKSEKMFAVLTLPYTAETKFEEAILMTALQSDASAGKSFDALYRTFPDRLTLRQMRYQELPVWIQELLRDLKLGETSSVISTEDQYMMYQTWISRSGLKRYEEVKEAIRNALATTDVLGTWLNTIRKEAEVIR